MTIYYIIILIIIVIGIIATAFKRASMRKRP
jgi:hypothetical protein